MATIVLRSTKGSALDETDYDNTITNLNNDKLDKADAAAQTVVSPVTFSGAVTLSAASTIATGTTIGTLTLADGSITDSDGSISFGNENLSTTGTLAAGATTITGDLTVDTDTLYVDSANDLVGIGVVTPGIDVLGTTTDLTGKFLHIENTAGAARLAVEGTTGAFLEMLDSGGVANFRWLQLDVDAGLGIWRAMSDSGVVNVDDILVMNMVNGNVGVGVSAPGHKLVVAQTTSASSYVQTVNSTTGTTSTDGCLFGIDASERALIWNYEATDLYFATNNVEVARFDTSGNLGIGETAPLGKLHVKTADTGTASVASANAFVIEATGTSGMTILNGTASSSYIAFGDQDDQDVGWIQYNHATNEMLFRVNASIAMTVDSSQNVGIGETAPLGRLHVKEGDSGASANATANQIVIEDTTNSGLSILSSTGGYILFGDSASNAIGQFIYSHSDDSFEFVTASTSRAKIITGMTVGSPTGGDKGAGTINATAVYDDNVLLTCYVFDQEVEGYIDEAKWDNKVPDRITPATKDTPETYEIRTHELMRKFKYRIGTDYDPLDIDKYAQHWKDKKHLTSMPNEATYDPVKGKMDIGNWVQRLIETVEIQAIHIDQLNQRLKALEAA